MDFPFHLCVKCETTWCENGFWLVHKNEYCYSCYNIKIKGEKKVKCNCGSTVRQDGLYKHKKTHKHIMKTMALI